jgi:hypothetical protein
VAPQRNFSSASFLMKQVVDIERGMTSYLALMRIKQ